MFRRTILVLSAGRCGSYSALKTGQKTVNDEYELLASSKLFARVEGWKKTGTISKVGWSRGGRNQNGVAGCLVGKTRPEDATKKCVAQDYFCVTF
jgi:hypothetical protein